MVVKRLANAIASHDAQYCHCFCVVVLFVMPPKKKPRLVDLLGAEPDSELAMHLIRQWSWGLYSANEVSVLARNALSDQKALLVKVGAPANFVSQSLEMLANIGSQGARTHIHTNADKQTNSHTHTRVSITTHTHTHTNTQTSKLQNTSGHKGVEMRWGVV